MQLTDADAFELPPGSIRKAMELLRSGTHEAVSFHQYVRSAQTLLSALVETGWTISPPSDHLS